MNISWYICLALKVQEGGFSCCKLHSPCYKVSWAVNSLTRNSRPSTIITDHSIGKSREPEGSVLLRGQLPKSWDFRGREDHLKNIAIHLDRGHQKPFEKSVLIIWGLSGAGKSQLASAYVKSQLAEDSGREIFWINGRDRKTFETSIVQFYRDKNQSQVSTQTQVTKDTDRESTKTIESFSPRSFFVGNDLIAYITTDGDFKIFWNGSIYKIGNYNLSKLDVRETLM